MNSIRRTRVITVEHHMMLREGLAALLSGQPDIDVVRSVSTADEAMKYLYETEPDLALVDVDMPGGRGLEVIRRMRKERPLTRVIALVGYEWDEAAVAAAEAGACALLAKDQIAHQLLAMIRGGD